MPDISNYEAIIAKATNQPSVVAFQIEAAYASDSLGKENSAIKYYDAAWKLGVPESEQREFIIGYGSTLRNVGRIEESISLLESGRTNHPQDRAIRCFLALAYLDAGTHNKAVAELLKTVLTFSDCAPEVAEFKRALDSYCKEIESDI